MNVYMLPPLTVCGTNSYIVDCSNGGAVLIDAPDSPEFLLSEIKRRGLSLKAVLLTHGHCDHTAAVAALSKETGCAVYIHEMDRKMLTDKRLNLADYIMGGDYECCCDKVKTVAEGDTLTFGEITFSVLHTPGHTEGSVCYLAEDILFTGDTLFCGSMGRTDFAGGSAVKMRCSLNRLKSIDRELQIYPGHGEITDLGREKTYNMFLQGEE